MILAAGRGQRMRPLTDALPKPLLQVGGKPLIQYHLEKLAATGYQNVVINHAWLGQQICRFVGDGARFGLKVSYSPESPALETAGGIVRALPLLLKHNISQVFTVINGDVFCDFDFDDLPNTIDRAKAHLVMVDNPEHHLSGDFGLQQNQLLLDAQTKFTFSGIALYHADFFAGLEAKVQPLRPVFEQAISARALQGQKYSGYWCDVGTPQRLELLDARLNEKGD